MTLISFLFSWFFFHFIYNCVYDFYSLCYISILALKHYLIKLWRNKRTSARLPWVCKINTHQNNTFIIFSMHHKLLRPVELFEYEKKTPNAKEKKNENQKWLQWFCRLLVNQFLEQFHIHMCLVHWQSINWCYFDRVIKW